MAQRFDYAARCPVLIGRDRQLSSLTDGVEQVARGRGQTMLIAGEAGVGKSRLVSEAKSIVGQHDWLIVEGHCFEPDRILPYAPLLDLLRSMHAGQSPADIATLLAFEARDLVKILPELDYVLGDLHPAPSLDPIQEQRMTIQAITTVILRLSTIQPILVVIEDLHWSDDTSFDVLLHLARRISDHPVLLVLTYRDDEIGPGLRHFLATIDRERLAAETPLHRLGARDVGAMIGVMAGTAHPVRAGFRDALYALTDGNPFFVEEVLGALQVDDGTATSLVGLGSVQLDDVLVPRSVHDAVHRRMDLLSPAARHVLELASVAGRSWDFSLLQVLTGHEEAELVGLVKELLNAQLLVEGMDDRFAFRHALTQKAVYSSLLSRERRRLHQASADAYEQLDAVERGRHLADLAYHNYEAGNWPRALEYASRAGEQAMELYAPQAAIEQFSRALDAAQRLSRSPAPGLFRARGQSYETLGDFEHAREDYETALTIARASNDRNAEWRVLLDLGLLWAGRDYEQSAAYCQRALAIARKMDDPMILAHSLNRVGNWYTNIARPRDGFRLHREALDIVTLADDPAAIAETLDLLGVACYVAGNPKDSYHYYTQAIEHCRDADDRQRTAWCLSLIALCGGSYQTDAGATAPITLEESEQRAESAIDLAQEIDWRPGEAFAEHVLGMINGASGRYDRAFTCVLRSLALAEEIDHHQWAVAGDCGLGALYLDLLDARRAREHLEKALAGALAMGSRLWVLTVSSQLAAACALDGDHDAGERVLDNASLTEIAESNQGARSCWLSRAELFLVRGEVGEALRIADDLIVTHPQPITQREAPRLARLRGEALTRLGLLEDAEVALRDAVAGATGSGRLGHLWPAQVGLGRVLRMRRRYADAEIEFAAARMTTSVIASSVPEDSLREAFLARSAALIPSPRRLTDRQAAVQAYGGLTEREREVAVLVARGLSNRAIADRLAVSQPTVATHVSHILAKLGVSSRSQVAAWAADAGLLRDHS